MERIPISGPSITKKEIDYVTDAVTNAWYGNANIYNERFEIDKNIENKLIITLTPDGYLKCVKD